MEYTNNYKNEEPKKNILVPRSGVVKTLRIAMMNSTAQTSPFPYNYNLSTPFNPTSYLNWRCHSPAGSGQFEQLCGNNIIK